MTPTLAADSKQQLGFTLLEIMLVLGIAAMLATIIGPRLLATDGPGFNASVREVNGLLNHARRLAVVQGQDTHVELIVGSAPDIAHNTSGQSTVLSWYSHDIQLSFTDSTQQQRRVDDNIRISFYPEGGSSGGRLTFEQDNRRTHIDIDPFSGRVRTQDDD